MGDNSGLRLTAVVVGDIVGQKFAANREGILAARRYVEAKGILATAG